MASVVTAGSSSGSGSKQIPLHCTVCPETPRFSDVSHLLTHIASKGHLHHETQTKLKAHQDVAASQPKRKIKRTESDTLVKNEREDFPPDFPMFPGFYPSDNENEVQDDYFGAGDMMALKGQVWPGMGKMDLANEDMKRTRNQRKPKSVIEKMRRTSEGIEPTQVVMTAEFEVERIKDVYDSSSPVPDQEDATPVKKTAKPRRKRGEPLAEISANIPRGGNRRLTRDNAGHGKSSKPLLAFSRTPSSDITPTLGQFKRSHDIFRDDDKIPTHSNIVSPTPGSRDIPDRGFSTRDLHRGRGQEQAYLNMNGHVGLGSLNHSDLSFALNGSSIYNNPPRFPFAASNHFNTLTHDHFRLPSGHTTQHKFDDYASTSANEGSTVANHYLDIPNTNPLFSQDRVFLGSCGQSGPASSLSPLRFTSINHNQEASHSMRQNQPPANIKLEPPQLCDVLDDASIDDEKESRFPGQGIWESQGSDNGIDIHEDLRHDELEL
ncbi:hypothetical protein CI102_13071 [Trichoderma harzianum]|nr:hypothetical protein CI102_13071 [Trichoderma harzianum]